MNRTRHFLLGIFPQWRSGRSGGRTVRRWELLRLCLTPTHRSPPMVIPWAMKGTKANNDKNYSKNQLILLVFLGCFFMLII
ncbi:hypothetical protein A9G35_06030 [Gilliamella sp. Choc5-1]|nr:hypothetical protein A9G35_06030 [Gilliamella apicola]